MALTWNPADCSPNINLSNGNTTATKAATGEYSGVRGTDSHSTGLRYFEATVPDGDEAAVGLAMKDADLDAPLGYDSIYSIGLYAGGTMWMEHDPFEASGGGPFGNTQVGFLVDLTARKLWVKNSEGWILGGDPAASGAGIDISLLSGALYPTMAGYFAGDTSTIYGTAETITLGLPSGATLWGDDGGTEPPSPIRKPIRSICWL